MLRLAFVLLLLLFTSIAQATYSTDIHPPDGSNSEVGHSRRTLFDIIWGCVSTTFICAWTTTHANIPPREGPVKRILRRLDLVLWTIMAPEILPGWALNQTLAAKTIKKVYNKEKGYKKESCGTWKTLKTWISFYEIKEASQAWTLSHGHFLIMGGIHLVEPAEADLASLEAIAVDVQPTESNPLVDTEEGSVAYKPKMEEGRITILTLEMLRELVRDPSIKIRITEDEISDRSKGDALSKFIFILQTSWFILQCIARRIQGLHITQLELTTLAMASLNAITLMLWWKKPLGAQAVLKVYANRKLTDKERNVDRPHEPARSVLSSIIEKGFEAIHENGWSLHVGLIGLGFIVAFPLLLIVALVLAVSVTPNDLAAGGFTSFPANATHVSTFYVPRHQYSRYWHLLLLLALGSVFGGIHCAGWDFSFPTYTQRQLWHAASLAVAVIPIALIILLVLLALIYSFRAKMAGRFVTVIFVLMYAAARLILLAQAITLLRHLPPSAFITVDWTQFYPHLF